MWDRCVHSAGEKKKRRKGNCASLRPINFLSVMLFSKSCVPNFTNAWEIGKYSVQKYVFLAKRIVFPSWTEKQQQPPPHPVLMWVTLSRHRHIFFLLLLLGFPQPQEEIIETEIKMRPPYLFKTAEKHTCTFFTLFSRRKITRGIHGRRRRCQMRNGPSPPPSVPPPLLNLSHCFWAQGKD